MVAYLQGQAPRLLLLSRPVTTESQAQDLPGCCGCMPPPGHLLQLQGLFCYSTSLPHHMFHLMGSQSCHEAARKFLGTFATLCATLVKSPCSSHSGHPLLLEPGTAPSSSQLGVWEGSPYLGKGFPRLLGHCSPTWKDKQVTSSEKAQTDGKKGMFHPEQPVWGRCSSQALTICHLLQIF